MNSTAHSKAITSRSRSEARSGDAAPGGLGALSPFVRDGAGQIGRTGRDAQPGWTLRRRIMAALRASCMVLGINRRRHRGLGALGHGTPAAGPLSVRALSAGECMAELPAYLGSNTLATLAGREGLVTAALALATTGMLATTAQQAMAQNIYNTGAAAPATATNGTAMGTTAGAAVTGTGNTATGFSAGQNVTGNYNTVSGSYAGRSVTGNYNTASGYGAGAGVTGSSNIASGYVAGSRVRGSENIATGNLSGQSVTGDNNIASGAIAGQNVTGNHNIAVGTDAGLRVTGNYNVTSGYISGQFVTGSANIASGASAGRNVLGNNNIASGTSAGRTVTGTSNLALVTFAGQTVTGNYNIASGFSAGQNVTGDNNIASGTGAGVSVTGGTNVASGYGAGQRVTGTANVATGTNAGQRVTGDSNIASGYVTGLLVVGRNNIASGTSAGGDVTGDNNIASGTMAGQQVTGNSNLASGILAGYFVTGDGNITSGASAGQYVKGADNIASGTDSGSYVTGNSNIASGILAGFAVSGNRNIASGSTAGQYVKGDNNIATGTGANSAGGTFDNTVAIGTGTTANANTAIAIGNAAKATTVGGVALGAGSVDKAALPVAGATLGGTYYAFAGATPASVVSVGTAGGERQIVNVAAGQISATSTDAVNGSQLYAVAETVGRGWDLTTGATGTGVASGTTLEQVASGEQVALEAGDNLIVTQTGNTVNYALNPALTGITSIALTNGPTIDASGIDMQGGKITNLAAGTDPGDAVNFSQLTTAIDGTNLVFGGNEGGTVTRTNGQTLAIQGEGTTTGTYSGSNIKTVTDPANGAVNIQLADAPRFGTVTINDGGSGKITGVTAGTLGATSTDAVNGSQLFAVGSSTAAALGGGSAFDPTTGTVTASLTVGGTTYTTVQDALVGVSTTAAAGGGWNISAQGANATNVALSSTTGNDVDLNNTDGNIVVAKTTGSNDVTFDLANDLSVDSVTTGGTVMNASGLTIAGGPSITTAGVDGGGLVITNVAAGTLGATSTDAVNGSQLYAVAQTASQGWTMTTGQTGTGQSVTPTTEQIQPGETVTFQAGDNLIATQTGNTVNYALNPALTGITSIALTNGPTIDASGIDMQGGKITNLAAGTDPGDAVNFSQLTTAIDGTNLVFGGNEGGTVTRTNGQTLAIQGEGTTTGTYSGGNIKTVTDPANGAVNIQLADAPRFGTVTINDGGSGKITGVTAGTLGATSTDAVNGSQLYAVGSSTAAALGGGSAFDPTSGTVTASLTVGGTTYTSVQDALVGVSATAAAGWNVTTSAVGTGTVSGSAVADVASGSTATFTAGNNIAMTQNGTEVQVALADNIAVKSVSITDGPTIDSNGIAMGPGNLLDMGGNKITNLAPGTAGTDAVNLSQFNSGLSDILGQANGYTDQKVQGLMFDLSKVRRDARAGTAGAMAMSQVPQAFEPGMGIVGVGVSTFMGEQSLALGFSKASDNGRVVVKAAGTYNTRGEGGVAAGVGLQF